MRPIDADALKMYMCNKCGERSTCEYQGYGCSTLADIDEQPTIEAEPDKDWISVNEKLPDDCVEVFVHDTYCGIMIGWYEKKNSIFACEFINQLDDVTHWMPLPEPPKGECIWVDDDSLPNEDMRPDNEFIGG